MTSRVPSVLVDLGSRMLINQLCLWSISAVAILVTMNTMWRLWNERDRLLKEDLSDEDRALAWRTVIFLIFPLLNLLDWRATQAVCDLVGADLKGFSYGLLWYQAVPSGIDCLQNVIPVLFAGSTTTTVFALCLFPALFFRPHPFLATVIGYTVAFTLCINLIGDPLLSLAGVGSPRWQLAFTEGAPEQRLPLVLFHCSLALIYVLLIRSTHFRLWFSSLTRPFASVRLQEAIANLKESPGSAHLNCLVGLLYDRAGLRWQTRKQLATIKRIYPQSVYAYFLEAVLAFRKRDYKTARAEFIHTSDLPNTNSELKASFLAAAACAAFAENDMVGAINLSERALEFDHTCVVARMVKVDVFLRQGRKEQAGEEILLAMHLGMVLDIENKIPLDIEKTYEQLVSLEETTARYSLLQASAGVGSGT